MKRNLVALLLALISLVPLSSFAATPQNLKGRIVLQVEANGEAWYVHPETGKASFLGRPVDALNIMSEMGLGISDENLFKLRGEGNETGDFDEALSRQLAGKILLQVESQGQAWYINPVDLQRYYLGRPDDALRVFRALGLGISNQTFAVMDLSESFIESSETLDLAELALEQPEHADVQAAIQEGQLQVMSKDGVTLHRFELTSPLSTEEYGYLGRGMYYLSSEELLSQKEYEQSPFYVVFEGGAISQQILNEMLALQASLENYKSKVGGYPVTETGPAAIGIDQRVYLTYPNGFYGTPEDEILYDKLELPLTDQQEYLYNSVDGGASYVILFSLPSEVGDYAAGMMKMTPSGITAHDIACIQVYEPVCGVDGKYYANSCVAEEQFGVEIDETNQACE